MLSKRLIFSKQLLSGRKAKITLPSGIILQVPDLGSFFDIVRSNILEGENGDFVKYMSGLNVRKGLALVTNFLTSGHVHADIAIKNYMREEIGSTGEKYQFPFHEVFKGSILRQWKYYSETRSECINIFDSGLGSENLKLLRFLVLNYLYLNSKIETSSISGSDCIDLLSRLGTNDQTILKVLNLLHSKGFIKPVDAKKIVPSSVVNITSLGAYCARSLSTTFVYVESCLHDTSIGNMKVWETLENLTLKIEHEGDRIKRMALRKERVLFYLKYLMSLEKKCISLLDNYKVLEYSETMYKLIDETTSSIIELMERRRTRYQKDYSVYHDK